ncbi:hypothetical protein AVEN_195175-1 [Araneus ventricosus]|uniref:Uncharacterized protein n=1 Tax=Araneus ventricosus TaxID=182803 RepID=A0A4Y2WQZ9_ARAVE|nr:hypothetical protein AVEN_195175-1 [Araneus ventricosus]
MYDVEQRLNFVSASINHFADSIWQILEISTEPNLENPVNIPLTTDCIKRLRSPEASNLGDEGSTFCVRKCGFYRERDGTSCSFLGSYHSHNGIVDFSPVLFYRMRQGIVNLVDELRPII